MAPLLLPATEFGGAASMSDVVAVMNDGVIAQEGAPEEVYGSPTTRFVADFVGETNLIRGTVGAGGAEVVTPLGVVKCANAAGSPGADASLCVRPEDVVVSRVMNGAAASGFPGTVTRAEYLGQYLGLTVAVADTAIDANVSKDSGLCVGEQVVVDLPTSRCRIVI